MLKIAKDIGLTNVVSSDGSNPITTSHPIEGSSVEVKLFVFNDDNSKYYTSITVKPIDINGSDESGYIQLALDNNGVASTYLSSGAILSMPTINDTAGHPIWVKVTTPAVAQTQNKTDIKLQIQSIEYAK